MPSDSKLGKANRAKMKDDNYRLRQSEFWFSVFSFPIDYAEREQPGQSQQMAEQKSVLNLEIIKQSLVVILSSETSIQKIPSHTIPLLQATIIEHLQFISYDKRNKAIGKALLEHDKTPNTAVSILERMYCLKTMVKINNILKRLAPNGIIPFKQSLHLTAHILRSYRITATHLICRRLYSSAKTISLKGGLYHKK